MTTTTKRTMRITWVHRGTGNPAGLGLDETFESDRTPEDLLEAALDQAGFDGINLSRYAAIIEYVRYPG